MGVTGLLPQLKSIQEAVSLGRYAGKTLAIDGYSWLHKAVLTCTKDLFYNKPTDAYVAYFIRKIDMLRRHQITPYFVFDGDNFGSKKDTEAERQESRRQYRLKGLEADRRGDSALAYKYYLPAIDVTPQMARSVMDYLESENISFVVAPYEADSQLVFLEKLGLVHGILSEDSDLLVFGCQTLITKLDKFGSAVEIKRERFIDNPRSPIGRVNDLQLRCLALISGCDYTKGITGVGPVTAIKKIKNISSIDRLIMSLELDGYRISSELKQEMKRADLSFRFQRVFNPITKSMDTLNEIPENCNTELLHSTIGDLFSEQIHRDIALGKLDPTTKAKLYSREYMLAHNMMATNEEPINLNPVPFSPTLNLSKQRTTISPVQTMLKMSKLNSVSAKTPAKTSPSLKRLSPKHSMDRIDDFFGSATKSSETTRKRSYTDLSDTPLKRVNNQLPTPLSSAEDLSGGNLLPSLSNSNGLAMLNLSPTSRRLKRLLTSSETKPISSKFFSQQMAKSDTVADKNNGDFSEDLSIATGSEADVEPLAATSQSDSNITSGNGHLEEGNILDELHENTLSNIDDMLNDLNEHTKKSSGTSIDLENDLTSSDLELSDVDNDVYEGDERLSQEVEKISRFKKEFLQTFKFEQRMLDDMKTNSKNSTSTTSTNANTLASIKINGKSTSSRRIPLNTLQPNVITSIKLNEKTSVRRALVGAKPTTSNSIIKITSLSDTFMYKGQAEK